MKRSILTFVALLCLGTATAGCQSTHRRSGEKDKESKMTTPQSKEFTQACRSKIQVAQGLLEELLAGKDQDTLWVLDHYNQLGTQLDNAAASAGLHSNVNPDESIRSAAEICEQEVSQFATDLSLNRELYEVFEKQDNKSLDAEAKRLLTKVMDDFRRSGVDKDEATRDRIKKLEEELVTIGQDFGRNIRTDVRTVEVSDLSGLPEDYIQGHPVNKEGKFEITTDYPDYLPFILYADDSEARRQLSTEFKNRGYPKNMEVLDKLLAKRHELATLLGYAHWADYVTEDKMIKNAAAVSNFIEEVSSMAQKRAQQEYELLLDLKRKDDPKATVVKDWEKSYLEEKLKARDYAYDSQAVRPYFQYRKVKEGLLDLTKELYGLEYERIADAKIWHTSVEVYDVFSNKKKLGRIYLDMHPREDKYKHAAQFTLKSGVKNVQLPEGVLVCNFPEPGENGEPALMDHDQVRTFFHEFGHLLHHVLGGNQKWIRFSGVATEWDFVEAPSQFFEEWAWDAKVLARFATHHETGKAIPAELVKKMREADEYGQGLAARHQMFYASISLNYYNQNPSGFDTTELMKKLQAQYSMFPYIDNTHFQVNFGHLEGYSAMYYTYMWSMVIAKDLLTPFLEKGLLNQEVAERYRKNILEAGGTDDAAKLVENFLGRPYSFDAFRKWLEGTHRSAQVN